MNIVFDTHALVWWWQEPDRIPATARDAINDEANDLFVSAVSLWEITNKHRIGKWPEAAAVLDRFDDSLVQSGFIGLPIGLDHARLAGSLPGEHKDPFDRMLAAQCRVENMSIVTADPQMRQFGLSILWSTERP